VKGLSKESIRLPLLNPLGNNNQVTDLAGSWRWNLAEELPGVWRKACTVYGSERGQDG